MLVCDDEPHIVRALKIVLREAGFEALPAETAAEALHVAALQPPDAAILDLVLPDGDGVEVCRGGCGSGARCRSSSCPRSATRTEKVRALEAGADDYVTKPFSPRELVARLQAALRRGGPRRRTSRSSTPTGSRSTWPRARSGATARRST